MKTFRELDVWKKAMDLVDKVYDLVQQLPKEERYALGDQLRRAVVSIPSNIAEGFGRETHADFAHFISQARGSLFEVDTQLEIAVRRSFIGREDVPASLMNDVSKLLGSLSRHLRSTPTPRSGLVRSASCLVPGASCAQSTKHETRTRHGKIF